MLPSWSVLNGGSFASVCVEIPPNTGVKTESDAVVTMSQGIEVSGKVSGGILRSMYRSLVNQESFFVTMVENRSRRMGDVLLAPADPGGICLHRLTGWQDSIMLTSGSFLASDTTVQITTVVQRGVRNSLSSGTGFFLMKATGRGILAVASYGSIHKFSLDAGDRRWVDNGHLVAWTADMRYATKLASSSVWGSISSGEGLMCEFYGPGIVYVQSHKPKIIDGERSNHSRSRSRGSLPLAVMFLVVFVIILSISGFMVLNFTMVKHHGQSHDDHYYGQKRYGNDYDRIGEL